MADRLLRHKPSGVTYIWQEVFAKREDFEEITPVEEPKEGRPILTRSSKAGLSAPEAKALSDAVLSSEASRNLP